MLLHWCEIYVLLSCLSEDEMDLTLHVMINDIHFVAVISCGCRLK